MTEILGLIELRVIRGPVVIAIITSHASPKKFNPEASSTAKEAKIVTSGEVDDPQAHVHHHMCSK